MSSCTAVTAGKQHRDSTKEGSLLGIPATGRHLQWDAIDLYRLKGGKISQEWASEDLTAILYDTGTFKAPWIP